MDLASTGSSVSKYKLDKAAVVAVKEKALPKEEVKDNVVKKEPQKLSMADFIDDFKI